MNENFKLARVIRETNKSAEINLQSAASVSSDDPDFVVVYGHLLMYADPMEQSNNSLSPLMCNMWGEERRIRRRMLQDLTLPFGIPSDLQIHPAGTALRMYRIIKAITKEETGNVVLDQGEVVHCVRELRNGAMIVIDFEGQWARVNHADETLVEVTAVRDAPWNVRFNDDQYSTLCWRLCDTTDLVSPDSQVSSQFPHTPTAQNPYPWMIAEEPQSHAFTPGQPPPDFKRDWTDGKKKLNKDNYMSEGARRNDPVWGGLSIDEMRTIFGPRWDRENGEERIRRDAVRLHKQERQDKRDAGEKLKRKWVEVESSDEPDSPEKPTTMNEAETVRFELGKRGWREPQLCTRAEQEMTGPKAFVNQYRPVLEAFQKQEKKARDAIRRKKRLNIKRRKLNELPQTKKVLVKDQIVLDEDGSLLVDEQGKLLSGQDEWNLPNMWIQLESSKGLPYFNNRDTNQSQWKPPPGATKKKKRPLIDLADPPKRKPKAVYDLDPPDIIDLDPPEKMLEAPVPAPARPVARRAARPATKPPKKTRIPRAARQTAARKTAAKKKAEAARRKAVAQRTLAKPAYGDDADGQIESGSGSG